MSTRDDLALAINKATFAFGYEEGETGRFDFIADRLLAQGWRPPMRMISTVEDLEALPDGTIFKGDAYGGVWEKHDGTYWWGNDGFGAEETLKCADEYEMGTLRVIWEPEEDS